VQHFEPFTATFEQGVEEGDRLLSLLIKISPELEPRCNEYVEIGKLQPVFDFIIERSQRYKYPYLEGFLSRVIKPTELESKLVRFWGLDEFVENQSQYAPVCNFPEEFKFVQFASWGGEYCDGDGWCLDLGNQEIVGVIVSSSDESIEAVRLCCYGVFPAFDFMTSFLETSARRRGWID
jgi:hypothetical protein